MANTIFNSLKNIFTKKVYEVNESIADPIADGKAAIASGKANLDKLTVALHDILSSSITIKKEHDGALSKVVSFEKIAQLAGAAGNTTDLSAALINKKNAQEKADSLQVELVKNTQIEKNIRTQIDALNAKLEHASVSFDQLKVRAQSADIRQSVAKASASLTDTSSLDSFEKAVTDRESSAESWEQVADTNHSAETLETKYNTATNSVSDEEMAKYLVKK